MELLQECIYKSLNDSLNKQSVAYQLMVVPSTRKGHIV